MKTPQENLATLNIWSRNVTTSTREPTTRAWISADIWRQDGAICSKNRKIVPYHGSARIPRLTVSVPDYGSWLKCIHFTYILCRLFVYILLTFYVFSSLLFSKILFRLSLMVWSPCLFLVVIFHKENDKILQIFSAVICVHSTNINWTFLRHFV